MKVYKYRYGSKRDLESLKNDYFYAPLASALNDPFENLFSSDDFHMLVDSVSENLGGNIEPVRKQFNILCEQLKNVGIYSLSKHALDELLWAYYADSHSGFCIEYELDQLIKFIKPAGHFEVDYKNDIPKLTFDSLLGGKSDQLNELLKLATGTKSKAWIHEQEVRITMNNYGRVDYDYRAIKAIYFGLRMPKTNKELEELKHGELPDSLKKVSQEQVMSDLRGRGIKYYELSLIPKTYKLESIPIEDIYSDSNRYKCDPKFIDTSLIDYNEYGWNVSKEYFNKVSEIISREPKFYALNSIHIASQKSKEKNEPIIFAGYFYKEDSWEQIKNYWTLSEIDKLYVELDI